MRQGDIHWVAVTSSAIAKSLVQQYGEALRQTRLASISSLTSDALRELGYEPSVEAKEATLPALVDAIVQAS